MALITIKSGDFEAQIKDFGAELVSLKRISDGTDYLWCADPAIWGKTSPVLFPFVGALKDKSFEHKGKTYASERHGFGQRVLYKGEMVASNIAKFTLCANDETLKLYPFHFKLQKTLTLTDNVLRVEFTVLNDGGETLYYGVGGHTGFATEGGDGLNEYSITFENSADYICTECDENGLSTCKKTPLVQGDTFQLNEELFFKGHSLVFDNVPSNKLILSRKGTPKIGFSFENLPALVIWSAGNTNRYVCIEPWTSIPESIDEFKDITKKSNLVALESGSSCSHSFTIEILN